MEVLWYLKGTVVRAPPLLFIHEYVQCFHIPHTVSHHSYLCCRVWEWYAKTRLTDRQILGAIHAFRVQHGNHDLALLQHLMRHDEIMRS